jgi:hypothetical protein
MRGGRLNMWRLIALAGAAAVVVVVGVAAPARATDGSLDVRCEAYYGVHSLYLLRATAHYEDQGRYRTWKLFSFEVSGGIMRERTSNVNMRLSEYGNVLYTYNSPDTLEYNRLYNVRPNPAPRTELIIGDDVRDHVENAEVFFQAIFDVENNPDPQCSASRRSR